MSSQELKSHINSMLGNSHRLLLPSYWWKKIFGAVVDKLDEKVDASNLKTIGGESLIGEGDITGFPIVHSKEELDALDVPLGGVASLVTGGPIVSSFEGCYMPSAEEMGSEEFFLDVFPKLTRVEKLNFHMPEDGSVPTLLCLLVDKRLNFKCVLTMSEEDGTEMIAVQWGCNSLENMVYLYFKDINDSINFTNYIPQRLNDELSSRDVRLVYFENKNGVIEDPEEQAETQKVFSQFFSREELIPYNSTPYIKSEGWDRISKDYIVSSIEELEKLNLPVGTIVSVAKEGKGKVNPYELFTFDLDASDEDVVNNLDKYTRIIRIESFAPTPSETNILNIGILAEMEIGDTVATSTISLSFDKGQLVAVLNDDRVVTQDELNDILKSGNFRLMLLNKRQEVADFVTNYTAFYGEDTIADTYIKGDTWEKLAKEGEEGAIFRELYIPSLEEPLTEAQKAYNKETIELYKEGKAIACISDNDTKFIATQLVFERGFPVLFFDSLDRIIIYLLDEKGDVADVDEFIKFEDANNKVTTISSASTDKEYPSAKAVYDAIQQSGGEAGPQGPQGEQGVQGEKGEDGVGITSVVQTTTSSADGGSNVVTVTLSDGKTSTFTVKNGSKGTQGEKGADGAKGDKGDKGDTGATGPQGNSGYTGAASELEVVNNLTQGGEASALSAEQGKVLDTKLTELSAEVGEKYGNYITNSEFLRAYVDANGVLLWGIKKDGSIHWAKGIPEHLKDYIDSQVPDKDLFKLIKSANSEDYDGMSEITMDAENKLLSWREDNGIKHEHILRIEKDLQFSKTAISNFMQNLIASGFTLKNPIDLSEKPSIEIPIPSHCAVVNIISYQGLATTKTQDLHCELEYLDKGGNYFKKYIVLNAQGQSSMAFIEKNQSIDLFNDAKREESCDITFGNWVTQDSYHLKCYYIDVFRGICNVAYKFAETVIEAMDSRNNRVKFDRANISTTQSTGDFATDFTDRALCHPDGFPFELYLNGEYYGLYAWNLKKHRANYSMKKNNYNELILDGIIDNSTFFNGVIKWSDIELRNPKTLVTMTGADYDGENPQELIDSTSAAYNPNNSTHIKTAQTKAIMVELSNVLAQIIAADDENAKKIFEQHFDVKSLITYFIVSNVIYHYDGFAKNWIWTIYDGIAAPTIYDADSIFGRTFQGTQIMPNSVSDILGDSENTITGQLIRLYKEEMDDYYKMLKDKGIVSVESIMRYIYGWLESATYAAVERNLEKWYSIPSYRESKTMNDGSVDGGMFDSPRRVKEWLKVRLSNLDNYFNAA